MICRKLEDSEGMLYSCILNADDVSLFTLVTWCRAGTHFRFLPRLSLSCGSRGITVISAWVTTGQRIIRKVLHLGGKNLALTANFELVCWANSITPGPWNGVGQKTIRLEASAEWAGAKHLEEDGEQFQRVCGCTKSGECLINKTTSWWRQESIRVFRKLLKMGMKLIVLCASWVW